MDANISLKRLRDAGDVEGLAARVEDAEQVIRAAKGPDSTRRTVEAIDAYEAVHGRVEPGAVADY